MPDPVARVGVAVVTHRSTATVGRTLRSLPPGLGAVVVVDNASPDDTVEVVRDSMPTGTVLVEQANVGFGAGNNAGNAVLPPAVELVLFLNPDATISAEDLRLLVAYLDAHPRAAMVGPRLRDAQGPLHSAGREATLATELAPLLPAALGRHLPWKRFPPDYATTGPVGYVEGACMLVRRAALSAVGGFDEAYFLFFEELDLGVRLRAQGWEVHLVAEAWAEHQVAASRDQTPFSARPHLVSSGLRYLRRRSGRPAALLWWGAARASWWLRQRTGSLAPDERSALLRAGRSGWRR